MTSVQQRLQGALWELPLNGSGAEYKLGPRQDAAPPSVSKPD